MVLSILFSWASVDATLLRLITSLLGWIAAKAAFLRKSQSHGRKDLTFVRSFKVSQGDRHDRQDTIWQGFANRSTILPMNNLDGNMMKEDDANMNGAELIKHVELEINYTATKVEHTLPLMCKWFYKFHKGNNKSDVSYIDENSSDVCSGSQKSMGSLAQTAIANTASGSSGWVVNI